MLQVWKSILISYTFNDQFLSYGYKDSIFKILLNRPLKSSQTQVISIDQSGSKGLIGIYGKDFDHSFKLGFALGIIRSAFGNQVFPL